MIPGNGVPAASDRDEDDRGRDDSQQLRAIQDLIAKLEDVNKQLSTPVRTITRPRRPEPSAADASAAD
jgi:hypothetical protein